jgi:hypothetical protein
VVFFRSAHTDHRDRYECRKDGIGSDVVSFGIGSEGFYLVAAVRHSGCYPLHPIRVFRKHFNICKRFGLCGEGRVWRTQISQPFPVSQAAKKSLAIAVIDAMSGSPLYLFADFA